ncbi:MAG: DUF86 domain-containing protein [Tepidisphaeraceae bacterium]
MFLFDMLDRAQLVVTFVSGRTYEQFQKNRMLQEAVIRQLEIIGEAAKQVTQPTRALLPSLPFNEMARMRDLVVHVYWAVKLEVVWMTATKDMQPLIDAIEPLLPPDVANVAGGST